MLSDTFVRAWEYVRKGGAVENEKAFLYKIASNLIIDYRRKKKTLSLDALTEEGFDVSTDEHLRLEEIIDARQAVQALDKIPEQYRDALFMRFIQELGPKETAILDSFFYFASRGGHSAPVGRAPPNVFAGFFLDRRPRACRLLLAERGKGFVTGTT